MTIYALSSGIGTSGIAVVSIQGLRCQPKDLKSMSGPFPTPDHDLKSKQYQ